MEQQELLRTAMFRFGMNRDDFSARMGVGRRTFDKWLLPSSSKDFREISLVARSYVEDLLRRFNIRFDISPLGIYNRHILNVDGGFMGYKAIIPASDWVFVVFPEQERNELVVWRLACWGLTDQGDAIGLVSVAGGGQNDSVMQGTCRLVAPPPLRGIYKHVSELDKDEQVALQSGKPLKITP